MNKIFAVILSTVLLCVFSSCAFAQGWFNSNLYEAVKDKNYNPSLKDDFYTSVNHEWLVNSKLKPGYSRNASFTELQDIVDARLRVLMTDENIKAHDAELVRNLYSLWLDWDSRNKNGLADLPTLSKKILDIKNISELNKYFMSEESFNNNSLIAGFGLGVDNKQSEFYNIELSSTPLSLSDSAEYRTLTPNGERTKKMSDAMVTYMLKRLNYDDKFIAEILEKSFRFETKISASMMTYQELNSPEVIEKTYNPLKDIDELREKSKVFPFAEILEAYNIHSKLINLGEPEWLKSLNEIYNDENLEDIKAYLLCRLVKSYMTKTDEPAYREYQRLSRERLGISGSKPDEELAADFVHSTLPVPISKLYVKNYIGENTKQEITEIIQETVKFYEKMLESEEWLSQTTREKAIEKLKNMKLCVAYPDKWVDFDGLTVNRDETFFDAVNKIRRYKLQKYFYDRINTKIDHDLWIDDIAVVNSYYWPSRNSINIIAGILGGEFYNSEMSYEEKLGGIGSVIGHEISHAFDTIGSQFDKSGNVLSWWTEEDYKDLQERAAKLIKYLDGFTIEGQKYNGTLVQFETIADMAGIKSMLGIAKSRKDFDYDKFFRRYAKVWRLIQTKETLDRVLKVDVHALPFLRVNAVIQQFEEFYETYGIKSGDQMYLAPEKRVSVW
ncbi:MAG: M13 family metallopeptidase [Synergistaceae bacterium]|nr:M13 family metallopeptidase [Synergistaceae bacterium]